MRIEFLTQEDSLYTLPFFEELFRISTDVDIVHVSCCPIMGERPRSQLARELLWLYGPAGFARLCSRYVASRCLSRLRRPRNARRYYSIQQLCQSYSVSFESIQNPNSEDFISQILSRGSDMIVSVACPYILKRRLLSTPPMGCINLHHALLPRYRGMMPTFWQLYNGERSVGLTIHYMTEKLDEGGCLLQETLDIDPTETLDELIRRSKKRAARSLVRVLGQLESGAPVPVTLAGKEGSYFTFPSRQQIREFHCKGLRAI